jgi:ubiquinone biosynthesis protein Coq4
LEDGAMLHITSILYEKNLEEYLEIGNLYKLPTPGFGEVYIQKDMAILLNV